ncbi:hypothetical protein [Cupriavidus sp. IDO]|nr:hypothetical protein [Cupriavidus sp. IDO]
MKTCLRALLLMSGALLLAGLVQASPERPRDGGVACARADNSYCRA